MKIDTIVCGNYLSIVAGMSDGCVDAVITDPPFGINFNYGDGYKDDPEKYEGFMKQFVSEIQRVVGCGPIFVWQTMLNADKWHRWFPPGFRIFAGCKGFVQYRPTPVQYSWDPIIFWGEIKTEPRAGQRDYHEQRKAPFGAGRSKIPHPCPRPLEQVEYIVSLVTNENDLIFDPCVGSGTTAIAALRLNRHFYGCDINPEYVRLANKRIKKAQLEMSQASKRIGIAQGRLL